MVVFLEWGYPILWMDFVRENPHLEMDDDWGYQMVPLFQEPPIYSINRTLQKPGGASLSCRPGARPRDRETTWTRRTVFGQRTAAEKQCRGEEDSRVFLTSSI